MPIINDDLEPKTYAETKGNLFDLIRILAKQKPFFPKETSFEPIKPIEDLKPINNKRKEEIKS